MQNGGCASGLCCAITVQLQSDKKLLDSALRTRKRRSTPVYWLHHSFRPVTWYVRRGHLMGQELHDRLTACVLLIVAGRVDVALNASWWPLAMRWILCFHSSETSIGLRPLDMIPSVRLAFANPSHAAQSDVRTAVKRQSSSCPALPAVENRAGRQTGFRTRRSAEEPAASPRKPTVGNALFMAPRRQWARNKKLTKQGLLKLWRRGDSNS